MFPEQSDQLHTTPCIQKDNITTLKDDVHTIFVIIDGNGTGKGMKTDLALALDCLTRLEAQYKVEAEIKKELEIQSRVMAEIQKYKDKSYNKELQKKKTKREIIGLIISATAIGIALFSLMLKF